MKNIFLCIFLFGAIVSFAQPANNGCATPTNITNLSGGCTTFNNTGATFDTYIGGCMGDNNNVWFTFTAQGPDLTTVISGPAGSRPELAIVAPLGSPCNATTNVQVACVAPVGNYSGFTWNVTNLTVGVTYYIIMTSNSAGSFDICLTNATGANNPDAICSSAEAFCTGTSVTYPAGVNTGQAPLGPWFECLASRPNPAWFYFEIGTSGNIDITMSSSPARDIDFVLWGPVSGFPGACINELHDVNIEDCSFSVATSEVANITGAVVGETYIMMITNFSNQATNITFSQTGGTGATDCSIVLPIELLSFDVTKKGNVVEANWITVSESDNDFFTLERSKDGITWDIVEIIDGAGNSTSTINYLKQDTKPYKGTSYYRLKQTDYDGTSTYSSMKSVIINEAADLNFTIYPNPSGENENTYIQFSGNTNEEVNMIIYDITGKVVTQKTIALSANGSNTIELKNELSSGMYFVNATSKSGATYNQKLMVK